MKAQDFRGMPPAELNQRVKELREEIFHIRFKAASETRTKPADLRKKRKEIAVIKTVLRQKELDGKPQPVRLTRAGREQARLTNERLTERARRTAARQATARRRGSKAASAGKKG